jgi:hypothetical protein
MSRILRPVTAERSGTVHDLPIWVYVHGNRMDAYDSDHPATALWLAGAELIGDRWISTDGGNRSGSCHSLQSARGEVRAIAEAVLYARLVAAGVIIPKATS